MLSAGRILLCFASIISSWAIVLFSTAYIGQWLFIFLHRWFSPQWNDGMQFIIEKLPSIGSTARHLIITLQPSTQSTYDIGMWGIQYASIVLAIMFAFYSFRPIGMDILGATQNLPTSREKVDSRLSLIVKEISLMAGIKNLKIFVTQTSDVNAFVISKPGGNVIILTAGACAIPVPHLRWIIAHEMGHIRHGDTIPAMLWMASKDIASIFRWMRVKIFKTVVPVVRYIPVLRLFTLPVELMLSGLFYTTNIAEKMASFTFSLFDSALQRAIEYQADRYACSIVDAQLGIEVMQLLNNNQTRQYLLASHPHPEKRIKRMQAFV